MKKFFSFAFCWLLVLVVGFPFLEPIYLSADTTGTSTVSDTVRVTLTVDQGISITTPVDVTMTPSLGMSSNLAVASTTWNVKTNDPDGYILGVKASTSPAMKNGSVSSFADYTPASAGVPETWSVPSGAYEFGYSAYGTVVNTSTWGTGTDCGSGSAVGANKKYNGFATTTSFTIASKATTTTPTGEDTTVCFAAQQNNIYAPSGTYIADIIATATVQ